MSTDNSSNHHSWQTDACINSVNLKHAVQFVSPVYLSRVSKQSPAAAATKANDSKNTIVDEKTSSNTIQEENGVLFLKGPESDKRLKDRELEQQKRQMNDHHHHSTAMSKKVNWALERVVAMPSMTNASEWMGDMNRCISRLSQSMKRSAVPKLRESVTLHSSIAVVPLGVLEEEKEEENDNNEKLELLILREALHQPKSKKLRKFFERIPASSSTSFSSEQEREEEEVKRVALHKSENFDPFFDHNNNNNNNNSSNTINQKEKNDNNNNIFLSVSSPAALSSPRNHNDAPVRYARNWIPTTVSASSAPYYSFLTGNTLNIEDLQLLQSSESENKQTNDGGKNSTTNSSSDDDDEQDIEEITKEENRRHKRTQKLLYNEILSVRQQSTSSIFADVLNSPASSAPEENNKNNKSTAAEDSSVENNNNNSNNHDLVLISPVKIEENLFRDDEGNIIRTPETPLREHEILHNRIQTKLDSEYDKKNDEKVAAQNRVTSKIIESPEYAICMDLIEDEDQRIASSNPIRKLHDLDPSKVDKNKLFTLSNQLEGPPPRNNNNGKSTSSSSLFPSRTGFLNETDEFFSEYLSRVLVHPLSSFFRILHFNLNAHPEGRDDTHAHSATHAVIGTTKYSEDGDDSSSIAQRIFNYISTPFINKKKNNNSNTNENDQPQQLFSSLVKQFLPRPWLLDFYWEKTHLPPHRITSEIEQYSGGRCEVVFAEAPSWTFYGNWKDRSISQKPISFLGTKNNNNRTENQHHLSVPRGNNNDNNNDEGENIIIMNQNFTTTASPGGLLEYLSQNRQSCDAQVSPSPKYRSHHRDPTQAGILPPNSIRKRPQVGATRIAKALDQTVKDDLLMSNDENNFNNNNSNIYGDLSADAENDGIQMLGDNNNDSNEVEIRTELSEGETSGSDENDASNNNLNRTIDLDATAKQASFLLRRELQNISANNTNNNKTNKDKEHHHRHQTKRNNSSNTPAAVAAADSPQIRIPRQSSDGNDNTNNSKIASTGRNLDSEFRNASAGSTSNNNNLRLTEKEVRELVVTTDGDDNNAANNKVYLSPSMPLNNGEENQLMMNFAVPPLADLTSQPQRFFSGAVGAGDQENDDPQNRNNTALNRVTASCRRHYDDEFLTSPLGLAVDQQRTKRTKPTANNNSMKQQQQKDTKTSSDGKDKNKLMSQQHQPKSNIVHIADGRSVEIGASYHYRWKRSWEVEENDTNNNNKSHQEEYKYKSFWDRFETRASCSLMCGFTKPSVEFAESRASVIRNNNSSSSTTGQEKTSSLSTAIIDPRIVASSPAAAIRKEGGGAIVAAATAEERAKTLPVVGVHHETRDNREQQQQQQDHSVIRRHYLLPGQKPLQTKREQHSTTTNNKENRLLSFNNYNNYFGSSSDNGNNNDNSNLVNSRLYSVFNTSASCIAERSLTALTTLRFRGGARWAAASDENDIPYLDSSSSSSNNKHLDVFFNGSGYLNSVFSDASRSSCIHKPQSAFSLEFDSFWPYLTGFHTNFFIGGNASCRLLEGLDFLSAMNTNIKKGPTLFSSLVSGAHHTSNSTNVIAPAIAQSAESRVNRYLRTHQENNANNFFTTSLNLRTMAEVVWGFSFSLPLNSRPSVDEFSEYEIYPDGHTGRLEFSWWCPIWSFDSFEFNSGGGGARNSNSKIAEKNSTWRSRFGLSLVL